MTGKQGNSDDGQYWPPSLAVGSCSIQCVIKTLSAVEVVMQVMDSGRIEWVSDIIHT